VLAEPPSEAASAPNEEDNIALFLVVDIFWDAGDCKWMRLERQSADGGQNDVGVLARTPGDVVTAHCQPNGVLGK